MTGSMEPLMALFPLVKVAVKMSAMAIKKRNTAPQYYRC